MYLKSILTPNISKTDFASTRSETILPFKDRIWVLSQTVGKFFLIVVMINMQVSFQTFFAFLWNHSGFMPTSQNWGLAWNYQIALAKWPPKSILSLIYKAIFGKGSIKKISVLNVVWFFLKKKIQPAGSLITTTEVESTTGHKHKINCNYIMFNDRTVLIVRFCPVSYTT